jgi:hypothetical protein
MITKLHYSSPYTKHPSSKPYPTNTKPYQRIDANAKRLPRGFYHIQERILFVEREQRQKRNKPAFHCTSTDDLDHCSPPHNTNSFLMTNDSSVRHVGDTEFLLTWDEYGTNDFLITDSSLDGERIATWR